MRLTLETRHACFRALVVARAAGEGEVCARRTVSALLRDPSVRSVCDAIGVSTDALIAAADGHAEENFQSLHDSVERSLVERQESFGSPSHIESAQPLPLSSNLAAAFRALPEVVSTRPVDLLIVTLENELDLASELEKAGLSLTVLRRAISTT
jgi:hypothetical protein